MIYWHLLDLLHILFVYGSFTYICVCLYMYTYDLSYLGAVVVLFSNYMLIARFIY